MVACAQVQVGRLDIAVQITLLMDRLQGRQYVLQQSAHLLLVQRFAVLQHRAERLALFVIHDDVGGAVGAKIAFHPHHIRMLNLGQHPRLVEKTLQSPRIVRDLAVVLAALTLGIGVHRHAVAIAERPLHRKIFLDSDPGL